MINTVLPFMFTWGKHRGSEHMQRALDLYESIPAEKNHIVTQWDKTGIQAGSAAQSQALITLKKHYCSEKKCLTCRIGNEIINKAHATHLSHP